MKGLTVQHLAEMVNLECGECNCLHATGLIKETLVIWEKPEHRELLCEAAQNMAEHYLEAAK